MKSILWLALGVALLMGGAWFGRAAWRAHKNIVTLDVRNAPLRDVVRSIERQTWETIYLDKRLDTKVTLKLKDTPLADALADLAEEAGAQAETLYAVHRSKFPLRRLQEALVSGKKIADVGWTNLAPRLSAAAGANGRMILFPPANGGRTPNGGAMTVNAGVGTGAQVETAVRQQLVAHGIDGKLPEGAIAGAVENAMDQAMKDSGGSLVVSSGSSLSGGQEIPAGVKVVDMASLPPEVRAALTNGAQGGWSGGSVRAGPGGVVTVHSSAMAMGPVVSGTAIGPDGAVETIEPEVLSPERIVIETSLNEKVGEQPISPTRDAAEQAARKVEGRCTTLYVLRHSNFSGMAMHHGRQIRPTSFNADGKSMPMDINGLAEQAAKDMKRDQLEQFEKLTPEQRARRAKEMRPRSVPANP